ncbi:DUF1064 domain-containing protein [Cupriavidus basilensis]|uniref:DUF1064 domain-containing protein n=1 Tax=Cupriavidus basilensis TaxID=68895 RepID=A0A643G844_9BURK|nr:DUF1064 domain-containing protein [Cupriavidus basilensis]QOT75071.1 DUF1064 domain-containing protein [Cupriavidus basilensis]
MTKRGSRGASGSGLPIRVRGALAGAAPGAGDSGVPGKGGEAPRAAGGGKTSLRRPRGPAGAPGKYGNQRIDYQGMTFDSKREFARYLERALHEKVGQISELRRQVAFELAPAVVIQGRKRPALRYVADFVYREAGAAALTIEDVKGAVTDVYRIKRHLMAVLGFEIKETR